MLATTEQELDGNRDALETFMAVTRRGYQEAMDDPAAAAGALTEAVPELDAELVRASAEYLSTRYAEEPADWGLQQEEVWTRFASFLVDAGMVEDEVDVERAFTNDLL